MSPLEAKKVILEMRPLAFTEKQLRINSFEGDYAVVYEDDTDCLLDGQFTADQLEAIAAWMRSPDAVLNCDKEKE